MVDNVVESLNGTVVVCSLEVDTLNSLSTGVVFSLDSSIEGLSLDDRVLFVYSRGYDLEVGGQICKVLNVRDILAKV